MDLGTSEPTSSQLRSSMGKDEQGKREMPRLHSEQPPSLGCSMEDSASGQKPWWRPAPFLSFGPWPRPPIYFFFFKEVERNWSSYRNPTALGKWLWSLFRQSKQEKYYFIIKVLSMCFESTHHELITRWAKQNKRNSSNDKHQKRMIRKAIWNAFCLLAHTNDLQSFHFTWLYLLLCEICSVFHWGHFTKVPFPRTTLASSPLVTCAERSSRTLSVGHITLGWRGLKPSRRSPGSLTLAAL